MFPSTERSVPQIKGSVIAGVFFLEKVRNIETQQRDKEWQSDSTEV